MPIFVIGIKDSLDNKNCNNDSIIKKTYSNRNIVKYANRQKL